MGSCKNSQWLRVRIIIYRTSHLAHSFSASISESLLLRNSMHTGPVRGLDFNPIQTNLLASGGVNGEVQHIHIDRTYKLTSQIGLHLGSEGP